jgi:hypothetical protein
VVPNDINRRETITMKSFKRLNSWLVTGALAGAGLAIAPAWAATANAAPAAAGGSQPATGCQIASDLYRDGNTIVTDAESTCQVPISLALYRNDVLVSKFSGGAAINIFFPCTPVSFDVDWKNSRGDHLKTNCF